jgi:hypothetical protein
MHAGRPDDRPAVDPLADAVGLDRDAPRVDLRGPRALPYGDAEVGDVLGDLARELLTEGRHQAVAGVEEDHSGLGGVDAAEVAPQVVGGEGELPGDLHAGGPATDDHERQPLGTLSRVVRALGLLEGPVEPAAQIIGLVQRLQAAGHVLPLVVAEVRGPRATGHDQAVVAQAVAAVEDQLAALDVDVVDLGHEDGGVRAALERRADRRGTVAR